MNKKKYVLLLCTNDDDDVKWGGGGQYDMIFILSFPFFFFSLSVFPPT